MSKIDLNIDSGEVSDRLVLSVINYNDNSDRLHNYPYIVKGDFALLAQLCVGEKNEAGQYTAYLTVTNDMLSQFGMEKDELFSTAMNNSKELFPVEIKPYRDYFMDDSFDECVGLIDGLSPDDAVVLSNIMHFNGTAAMFYAPEYMDIIANDYCKSDSIMVMPLGINRVLCMPSNEQFLELDYKNMYSDLLAETGCDSITSSVLMYNSTSKTLTEENGYEYSLDIHVKDDSRQSAENEEDFMRFSHAVKR